jgi:hypothetical protein
MSKSLWSSTILSKQNKLGMFANVWQFKTNRRKIENTHSGHGIDEVTDNVISQII